MSREAVMTPPFPSSEWFGALAACASESLDFERLGFADLRLAFEMSDAPGGPRSFGVVLDGYDVTSEGELDPAASFDADATIRGPLATWEEMVSNIVEHGMADGAHTLNALTIAGLPLAIVSSDPVRRDRVYRFAETVQQLLDSAAGIQHRRAQVAEAIS